MAQKLPTRLEAKRLADNKVYDGIDLSLLSLYEKKVPEKNRKDSFNTIINNAKRNNVDISVDYLKRRFAQLSERGAIDPLLQDTKRRGDIGGRAAMKDGKLVGNQKKLDANKDGKISGEDFKVLQDLEKRNPKFLGGLIKSVRNKVKSSEQMSLIPNQLEVNERPMMAEGGDVSTQMQMMLGREEEETPMLPDEQMEEDYVDYVVEETLSNEDRNYLIDALEKDDRLSEIFDQVVESATEFTGSGTVEGPGTGRSDSIPARLSDGEFVFTAKATEEIGADNLMSMMKDAEAAVDERQQMANGGEMEEEETIYKAQPEPQTQDIRVTKETVGSQAMMKEEEDLVGDELKKSMLSTRPYVRS
jgi:hypothetical protein